MARCTVHGNSFSLSVAGRCNSTTHYAAAAADVPTATKITTIEDNYAVA
jgi:hypothetical protein